MEKEGSKININDLLEQKNTTKYKESTSEFSQHDRCPIFLLIHSLNRISSNFFSVSDSYLIDIGCEQ